MITDGDLHHLLLFCLASPYFSRGWYSENSCLYKNSLLTIMINCYFCFVVELDFPLCLRRQPQPQSIFSSLKFFCRNKKRTVFFLIIGSVCFGQPVCYCELSQMTCNVIRYFRVLRLAVRSEISRDGFALLWLIATMWREKCPSRKLWSLGAKSDENKPLKINKWIQKYNANVPLAG